MMDTKGLGNETLISESYCKNSSFNGKGFHFILTGGLQALQIDLLNKLL